MFVIGRILWQAEVSGLCNSHKLTGASDWPLATERLRARVRVYDGPLSNKSLLNMIYLQPHADMNIEIRALVALYVLTDQRNENAHIEQIQILEDSLEIYFIIYTK